VVEQVVSVAIALCRNARLTISPFRVASAIAGSLAPPSPMVTVGAEV